MAKTEQLNLAELSAVKRDSWTTLFSKRVCGKRLKFQMNFYGNLRILCDGEPVLESTDDHEVPSADAVKYWNDFTITMPAVDAPIYVKEYSDSEWKRAHFSHIDDDQMVHVFDNGLTSWTIEEKEYSSTMRCEYWKYEIDNEL